MADIHLHRARLFSARMSLEIPTGRPHSHGETDQRTRLSVRAPTSSCHLGKDRSRECQEDPTRNLSWMIQGLSNVKPDTQSVHLQSLRLDHFIRMKSFQKTAHQCKDRLDAALSRSCPDRQKQAGPSCEAYAIRPAAM